MKIKLDSSLVDLIVMMTLVFISGGLTLCVCHSYLKLGLPVSILMMLPTTFLCTHLYSRISSPSKPAQDQQLTGLEKQ